MNIEEVLAYLEELIIQTNSKSLDSCQTIIFKELCQDERQTYLSIALKHDYTEAYLKEKGAELWNELSKLLKQKVTKKTFKATIERLSKAQYNLIPQQISTNSVNYNFVGREEEINEINTLVCQGAKFIVIQGKGGVGKTTLGYNYFKKYNFNILQLRLDKEIHNISTVESVIEEWLQREFNEQPARDFHINLERLRRKLQERDRKIGIFINSLETALDKYGRLIEERRHYLQLLEILSDPYVNSVTLITTREPLYEPSIQVCRYRLKGLDENSWRQFFGWRNINSNSPLIGEMWRAYGGNAKAMQILSGAIITDFYGDIDTYWRETKKSGNLLLERELKDLVTSQFQRLEKNNLAAYNLLCRLGCYRYKDIPSVPIEGLFCLLWDVSESSHIRLIRDLQDLSLIEFHKGKYWLHSIIKLEAQQRLKSTNAWDISNRRAAEFWTSAVHLVIDANDARISLESYYHYLEIEDYAKACDVILRERSNRSNRCLTLGASLYQLGLLQKVVDVISPIISQIKDENRLIDLYHILGYSYRIIGSIDLAIDCFKKSTEILDSVSLNQKHRKIRTWFNIGLCKMELWEIDAAKFYLNKVYEYSLANTEYSDYIVYSQSCIAFIDSYTNQFSEDILAMADKALHSLYSSITINSWGAGHNLVNLAVVYKNLGYLDKAWEICKKAILNSEGNKFTQIHARAIICMAEVRRQTQNFDSAVSLHDVAIEMLSKIGAKSDLAEAYYQLALTFYQKNDNEKSRENFDLAIKLFQEMQAPKQIQKVQAGLPMF
jgi:tetratricopeptide (TPR) repeat protein